MELVKESKGKKFFVEDNAVYSMIDMGSYIGFRNRDPFDKVPENYRLMFYDKDLDEGRYHMEALVDDKGNYIKFKINLNDKQRIIEIDNGMVLSDITNIDGKGIKMVVSNKENNNYIPLENYLSINQDKNNPLLDNDYIANFIYQDNYLSSEIKNNKTR